MREYMALIVCWPEEDWNLNKPINFTTALYQNKNYCFHFSTFFFCNASSLVPPPAFSDRLQGRKRSPNAYT